MTDVANAAQAPAVPQAGGSKLTYADPTGNAAARNADRDIAAQKADRRAAEKPTPLAQIPEPLTTGEGTGGEQAAGEVVTPPSADETLESHTERDARESAKYRKRAQEAETERDNLRAQLTGVRTAIVEGIIGSEGATIDAVIAGGHQIDDLFDQDGRPDLELIESARADVEKRFNITRPLPRIVDRTPHAVLRGGSNPGEPYGVSKWTAAFAKR